MKIAIITAMEREALPLFNKLGQVVGEETIAGVRIRIFVHRHIYLYLVICGVGEILAASATQLVIDRYKVDYILNIGFVGSLTNKLKQGDLVLIEKVVHYQYDLSSLQDVKKGQYNNRSSVFFELTQSARDLINHFLTEPLPVVTLASGDAFIADSETKIHLYETYGASVCDMELAGIAITALRNNAQIASVKIVSDNADESAPMDFNVAPNIVNDVFDCFISHVMRYLDA